MHSVSNEESQHMTYDSVQRFHCDVTALLVVVFLTLLHSEWPKLYGVLAMLSATGLKEYEIQLKLGYYHAKK